jgi:hypothetical protein
MNHSATEESMRLTYENETDQRDRVFRKFQLEKFDPRRAVPAVSMTVSADITALASRTEFLSSPLPH